MIVFCLEDVRRVTMERNLIFGANTGLSGAIIYINAKMIHNDVRTGLDPRSIHFSE